MRLGLGLAMAAAAAMLQNTTPARPVRRPPELGDIAFPSVLSGTERRAAIAARKAAAEAKRKRRRARNRAAVTEGGMQAV